MAALLEVTALTMAPDVNRVILFYASPQMSPGRMYCSQSKLKLVAVRDVEEGPPFEITSEYNQFFGPLIAGRAIFLSLVGVTAQGFRSAPLRARVVVT